MTTSPLKRKRSARGAFLSIRIASDIVWIEHEYQLEYPAKAYISAHWSNRDKYEFKRERSEHIAKSDRIEVDKALYIVKFQCDVTPEQKLKIVQAYHNRETMKVRFDNE